MEDCTIARERHDRRNDEINVPKVRLIDADGEQVGVVSIEDALEKAGEAGLDLVEVAPQASPPVCKIMDYGKHVFSKSKAQQSGKKKQKQQQVKEIKFRPGTDIGDYKIKLRKLNEFLEDGDKIKVTLRFRGREMAHQDLGHDLLARVRSDLEEVATVEAMPKMEGRQLIMVMAPRKK